MGTAWLIASGKGGVGKSTITASLGWALAASGNRTCVIDADIGLRDLDAILGAESRVVYDLVDLCKGSCETSQALIPFPHPGGLYLLPAAQIARSKALDAKDFQEILRGLKADFSFVLIDAPAGIERGLRNVLCAEIDETVLICTPDDVCMRDAERTVSIIEKKHLPRPRLIVNRLDEELIRLGEMYPAGTVAAALDIELLGELPEDQIVYRAMLQHHSVMECDCPARQALLRIADRMQGKETPLPAYGSKKPSFWQRLVRGRLKEVSRIDR